MIAEHLSFYRALAAAEDGQLLFRILNRFVCQTYYDMICTALHAVPDEETVFLLRSCCAGGLWQQVRLLRERRAISEDALIRLYERSMPPEIHALLVGEGGDIVFDAENLPDFRDGI